MSNLALAVVLWIVTVICIVGLVVAIKKKQKGLRNFFGIATLGLGFLAFGFSYDAISEIKIEASNSSWLWPSVSRSSSQDLRLLSCV